MSALAAFHGKIVHMPDFFSFEPNLKRKQRKQAFRFSLPIITFALLSLVLFGALYYAQEDEREQNQAKLIADTLWARQNLQFQAESLRKTISALAKDSLMYYSSNFDIAARQLAQSNGELVAVFKGNQLELVSGTFQEPHPDNLSAVRNLLMPRVLQRLGANLEGIVGPFSWKGGSYVAIVGIGQNQKALIVGLLDLGLLLDREMPWWFAQDNQVELLSPTGVTLARLVKGQPAAGVYEHSTSLDLAGLPLQMKVSSSKEGPRLFNYGITGAVALLLVLLLFSFLLLWRDSRRRLRMESKLEEEKLFRQAMQDSIAVGMRVWDLQGTIRYVNPAFCNMVGYSAERLVGAPFPLPYWPENNTEEYHSLVAKVIAGNSPRKGFETVYKHKDGHLINVLIVEAPLRDSQGVHVGWMSSVLDITDRKRSEELIAQQREQLQAASRFALVGEVASNIAHELNQPLGSMVSFAQAGVNLSRKGAPIEKFAELFTKLRDQAQRASRVVGSVQNLVRKRKPMRETLLLRQLIDSVRPSLESITSSHEVQLQFKVHNPEQA
ncbi:MAG: PAS domain S-box protein, partial [Limnobacter sp.]|nr:PAS domain S-box protein [Limnobacter sp.]